MSRVSFAAHNAKSVENVKDWHATYAFLGPEIFGGSHAYCPMLADLWSAGCVLHFMLYKVSQLID